ncbi:MAG: hypothetical protein ABSH42_14155 [Bryobacteraceae bacterium]|jgi:hypothetical protein
MRGTSSRNMLLAAFLLAPGLGLSQAPAQSKTLTVAGFSGQVPLILVSGKSYVEIESLARLTGSSLTFRANQTILTLPAAASTGTPETSQPAKSGFSKEFLRADIEEMTVIREWRVAIVNAVRNNYPVTEDWVARYRSAADTKLALAATALATESDRNGISLLNNEFSNMQKLSDKYLAMHKSQTYTSPDSLDDDPLNQQILDCARGLAALVVGGQFQDVSTCH